MFSPQYLDKGQMANEYRRALEKAETAILQAHLDKVAAADPERAGDAEVRMTQAAEGMKRLQDDWCETGQLMDEREAQMQAKDRQRFPNAMRHREP